MLNAALKYDKLMKPIARAMASLNKEKELKKTLSPVNDKVKELNTVADKLEKLEDVVDEKSFKEKEGLIEALGTACTAAVKAISDVQKDLKKKGDNPMLEELSNALDDLQKEAKKNLDDIRKGFKAGTKEDELEFEVPDDVTNMIALVNTSSKIAVPGDQSFSSTITLSWKGKSFVGLDKLLKDHKDEFIGAIGKALEPTKKDVAKAFKKWNSEFEEVQQAFDTAAGEKLFKDINSWFSDKLPKAAEPAMEGAVRETLEKICSKEQEKSVKIGVDNNYSNIAEFVLNLPDSPAKDLTKAVDKDSGGDDYFKAVKEVLKHYEPLSKSIKDLQKEAQRSGDGKSKFDPGKKLEEISKETSEVESNVVECEKGSEKLTKYLQNVYDTFAKKKKDLENNRDLKSDFKSLNADISESLKQLKMPVPNQLKKLKDAVKDSKEVQKTFKDFGGRDKTPPSKKDQEEAFRSLDKKAESFSDDVKNVERQLRVPVDLEKLKAFVDKIDKK